MSGTFYSRRGFLGLSAAAVAAGVAACTGGGTDAGSGRRRLFGPRLERPAHVHL